MPPELFCHPVEHPVWFKESQNLTQVELKEDPINTTYGLLDQIFKVLDEENIYQQIK